MKTSRDKAKEHRDKGRKQYVDRMEQKAVVLKKGGEKNESNKSTNIWVPFAIDAKGGEKKSLMKGGA